jgi:hypothetical protein
MTTQDITERAALSLLAQGMASKSEVAELAGVSRQLVGYWAKRDGIACERMRKATLLKMWRKALAEHRR